MDRPRAAAAPGPWLRSGPGATTKRIRRIHTHMTREQVKQGLVGLAISALVGVAFVHAPALANTNIKIKKAAFGFSGVNYFRGKAEDVRLGPDGQKKTPVGQTNYLDVRNHVKSENQGQVNVAIGPPQNITWSNSSDNDVNLGIKFMGQGGTGDFSRTPPTPPTSSSSSSR
jgi:hypothetical protein